MDTLALYSGDKSIGEQRIQKVPDHMTNASHDLATAAPEALWVGLSVQRVF